MADLKPGVEMDWAVAETLDLVIEGPLVLLQDGYYYLGKPLFVSDEVAYWSPSMRDGDALIALDVMRIKHQAWMFEMGDTAKRQWWVRLSRLASYIYKECKTRPEAICQAILAWDEQVKNQ